MLRWIANVFRRLVGGGESPPPSPSPPQQRRENQAVRADSAVWQQREPQSTQRQWQPPENHQRQPARHPNDGGGRHVDYYDNKYREEAAEEDRLMKECFQKASEARARNNHDLANVYVKEAKRHREKREEANSKGAKYVLSHNPKNNREDCVDLHGLKVREALSILQERLDIAKALNCEEYHVITGRGRHSQDNKPKIKPAVEKFLSDNQYVYVEDKHNPGSITVFLY